jgi:F0F1-type ATP synthase membrane subunit c/vacuolar-type H+-ATPase subunit K
MVGLIGFWIAFQAQAFISINQIGVAIWGFVCSGLIIGMARQNNAISPIQSTLLRKQSFNSTKVIIGFMIGILTITPLFSVVSSYKKAYAQQNADALLKSLEKWPYNANNMAYAADQLRKNKLYEYSYVAAKRTIKVFPNYYDAYRILYNLEITPEDEKLMAKNQMIRLDPLNTNFD